MGILPTKNKTSAQALPFKGYHNEMLQLEDGTFRCIIRVSAINNELLGEDENDDIIELMAEAINGSASQINQMTVSSERLNIDEYIEYLKQKIEKSNESYHIDRLTEMLKYVKETSIRQRTTKTFYWTVSANTKDEERAKEQFHEAVKKIEDSLQSAEIYVKVLKKHDGLRMLYEKLNPKTSVTQPYSPDMKTLQSIAPVPIIHNEDHSIMDGVYYRFYTIIDYPVDVKPMWFKKIFDVNAEVDTAFIYRPTGKTKTIQNIDHELGVIKFMQRNAKTKQSEKIELEKKEKSAIELIEGLSTDFENMYKVSVIIAVKDKSLKDLEYSCERVTTAISTSRMRSRQLVWLNNDPFWLTLPIAYNSGVLNNENMHWPMQTTALASILPFNSADFMMNKGIVVGRNPVTNSLIITDRRDKKQIDNPNKVIIAPTGRGKTWYAQTDMSRMNAIGTKLFVIDPEREYKFNHGERVVFSLGSEFCTNPFHIRSAIVDQEDDLEQDDDFSRANYTENVGQYLQRKIADMIPFFRYIYPKMDSTEEAELSEAIRLTYERKSGLTFLSTELPDEYPTLSDLYETCQDQIFDSLGNFIRNLKPYVIGLYKNMFNGQTNWSMDSDITVLDIHSLSDVIQPQMMYLLLQDIWEYIKINREEEKGLYVDEAWKLASPDNPQTLKFLFEMAKRIRKYGGYLTTITQNVMDFFSAGEGSRNYGQAIFDNAFFKVFLGLSENDYTALIKAGFSFSRKEERILKRKKSKGRGIYVVGSTRVELQSSPILDELQFIDPKEYKRLSQYEGHLEYSEAG